MTVLVSLSTKDDSVFIYRVMRDQITFIILIYYFSRARIRAFLYNGKRKVKGKDGQIERLIYKGLTWKIRPYPCRYYSPRHLIWGLIMS